MCFHDWLHMQSGLKKALSHKLQVSIDKIIYCDTSAKKRSFYEGREDISTSRKRILHTGRVELESFR